MASFDEFVEIGPEIIRVATAGKYVFNEMFPFLDRVKAAAEAAGKRKILIDCRKLDGKMTEAERFQGGQRIAEVFGSRFRVALLIPAENITKLGELTAVNRGAKFTVVATETEATEFFNLA